MEEVIKKANRSELIEAEILFRLLENFFFKYF
jgi:hypothetical protein